ncbi:MAG: hypothetical protein QNK51_00225 [Chitinophagales bacterium]|tara:strand:+ start:28900 stop:29610 length:711 start_codon:yes stop_codon:yes gene_type:complete
MKNYFLLIISIALLSIGACKEEQGEGDLNMKYAATLNGGNLELNQTYLLNGDSVYFTLIQYYICDASISDKDGITSLALKDVAFIDFSEPSSLDYNFTLDAAAYKNPTYTVGLSDERGATDPSSYASDHPMSLNRSMYWLMANAYVYFKIEGFRIKNGIDEPLVYHVGMDGFSQNKEVPQSFTINKGNSTTLITTLDLNEVFANINFTTEPETHTMNNMPLAQKLMNNFVNALTTN